MARPRIPFARTLSKPLEALTLALIGFYQLALSPYLGPNCRFQPTCSNYAREAIVRHGIWRGGYLSLRRLSRCHPVTWLGGGEGFDPVPGKTTSLKAHDV